MSSRRGEERTCHCGKPIYPCPCGPALIGDPPRQMVIMGCKWWLHLTGSHRCGWPYGDYRVLAFPRPDRVARAALRRGPAS